MPSRSDNSASSMLPLSRYCSISPFRDEYPLAEKSFVIVESDDRTVSSAPFSCSPEHRHSIAIRLREFLNLPLLFLPSILLYHFWAHPAFKLPNNYKVYKISGHFLVANHNNHIKDQSFHLQQGHAQTIANSHPFQHKRHRYTLASLRHGLSDLRKIKRTSPNSNTASIVPR